MSVANTGYGGATGSSSGVVVTVPTIAPTSVPSGQVSIDALTTLYTFPVLDPTHLYSVTYTITGTVTTSTAIYLLGVLYNNDVTLFQVNLDEPILPSGAPLKQSFQFMLNLGQLETFNPANPPYDPTKDLTIGLAQQNNISASFNFASDLTIIDLGVYVAP